MSLVNEVKKSMRLKKYISKPRSSFFTQPKKSFKRKQPENDKMHSMQSFEEFAEFQTFADDVMCVHRRSHFTADSVSRTSQNRSRDFFSDSTLLWKAGQSSSVEAAQVFRHGNETWRACNLETSNCAKTQPKQTLLTLAEEWRTFSHSQAATEDQRFDAISTDNPFQECVTDEILTKYFHVVTPTNDSIIRNQSLFLSDTRKLPVEITADAGVTEENIERSEQPNQFNLKIKSYSDLLYSRLSEDHIFRNFPLLPVTYKNQFQLQDRLDLFPQDIRKRPGERSINVFLSIQHSYLALFGAKHASRSNEHCCFDWCCSKANLRPGAKERLRPNIFILFVITIERKTKHLTVQHTNFRRQSNKWIKTETS